MRIRSAFARSMCVAATLSAAAVAPLSLLSQAAATGAEGTTSVRSVGTVKAVGGGTLSVGTDKGETTNVSLPTNVRVLQLAPGSTDLKTAQPASVSDIAQGDRVLVTGRPGDAGAITALRVILMKSGAIAQTNSARQQDWQRRGSGGVVSAVDTSAHTLTVTAGTRKETITTTPSTIFRRYAPGSVKFEDASVGKLDDVQPGDQVRVRGDKSADNATIAAEEVVSGAFRNIAGLVTRVDAGANTVTVSDLATKKPVTIVISSDSDLRSLPPEMAARFAARARGGAAGQAGGAAGSAAGGPRSGSAGTRPTGGAGSGGGSETASADGEHAEGPRSAGGGAGRSGDLSQVIARLPKASLGELKTGEAVMVVASGGSTAGTGLTAVTLLSGVEPLLAASPSGSANGFSISPWSLGGGGGEGAEGAGPQ